MTRLTHNQKIQNKINKQQEFFDGIFAHRVSRAKHNSHEVAFRQKDGKTWKIEGLNGFFDEDTANHEVEIQKKEIQETIQELQEQLIEEANCD